MCSARLAPIKQHKRKTMGGKKVAPITQFKIKTKTKKGRKWDQKSSL